MYSLLTDSIGLAMLTLLKGGATSTAMQIGEYTIYFILSEHAEVCAWNDQKEAYWYTPEYGWMGQ